MTNDWNPAEAELLRGVAALLPFVHAWKLPLNPEELHEMAWAVLFHARSDGPLGEIGDQVGRQLTEYDQANERMRQVMDQKLSEQTRDTDTDSESEASGESA